MSKAFDEYLTLRDKLYEIRTTTGEGYYSEDEEPILEAMDIAWIKLTKEEIAALRAQGSWKFGDLK